MQVIENRRKKEVKKVGTGLGRGGKWVDSVGFDPPIRVAGCMCRVPEGGGLWILRIGQYNAEEELLRAGPRMHHFVL